MERKKCTCATLFSWTCRISMLLFTVSTPVPKITGCELLEHANITCYWTAHSSENISYVMRVNTSNCVNNKISMGICNTTYTQCSVKIGSVSHCFCVDVLVFTSSISTWLPPYCFNGITEVKMYTPKITMLATLPENSTCLKLEWKEPRSEYVQSERNHRVLQIEYNTPQQAYFPKVNALLHDWQIDLCGLHPGTKHMVRVRAQDLRAAKHWSSWSGFAEATTAEAAPAAAPELWRHIQPIDKSGQRHITLLWKREITQYSQVHVDDSDPSTGTEASLNGSSEASRLVDGAESCKKPLPSDTNGVIVGYTASCWNDLDTSYWNCSLLDSDSTSCVLAVSAHACNCYLTASNSAGTSPSAHMYIPADEDAEITKFPENISVTALDDFQLKVEWTVTVNQSVSSFVVEWFPIPDTTAVGLHWKILNGSERSFIITEGVHPEIPYNVSVRVLHNNTPGGARFAIAFTRQGAPSVGPKLDVLQTTSNDVILKWQPVPLEKLHGFLQNYTVLYKYNGKMKSFVLNGDTVEFSLHGLSPGQYAVCVKAHTLTGGAESPWVTVTVGSVHIPALAIVLCIIGSLLFLVILLSQADRILQCLCPIIPDPSKSSLSIWPTVSPLQHKLPIEDKPSPPLFEPICTGGRIASNRNHHHELQTSKQVHKQVLRVAEQTFSEQNDEEPTEHLTTDLSYQCSVMETGQFCHHISSSCPEVPDLGMSPMDFCKSNIVPRLESSYERLESCSETFLTSDCAPLSKSCLRVDTLDPDDLFNRRSTMSKLKTYCYTHLSTSFLPVTDSYIDLRTVAENSTIHKTNCFSRLESSCYSHVSANYVPVPEPSLAYADFVTLSAADFFHQSSHMPKKGSGGYIHVSTSYLPLPLNNSKADFSNSVCENNSGFKSCIYNHIRTRCQKSCPDFEIEDVYRPLSPKECPLPVKFSMKQYK